MRVAYFASAAVQVVAAGSVGWVVGSAALERVLQRPARDIGGPERALGAIVGFIAYSIVLLLLHVATLGHVFDNAFAVPVAGAVVVAWGMQRRLWPRSVPWSALAAFAVLAILFVSPAVLAGSGLRTGDTPWHLGWTQQLLAGELLPSGLVPEVARNAYPWGFHAVLATLTRLVPGSDPLVAHEALHVIIVVGIPLAAACLSRRLDPGAGWVGAAAVAVIGGFGWIAAGEPEFILSPSLARYGADLVVASPNSMYELFPPVLPRELGLVLLGAAGALLTVRSDYAPRLGVAAGLVVGAAGLVSLPMLLMGVLWITAVALTAPAGRRLRTLGASLGPAIGVLALWAVPVAAMYIAYGGFVDITPRLGVEWPLGSALWSWGLLLPLAAAGVVVVLRERTSTRGPAFVAMSTATALYLLLTLGRAEFGWNPAGNATLLHQGRVWPVAHLLAAAFAGLALVRVWGWLGARTAAAIAVAGVLAVGAVSPVYASIKLEEWIASYERGYLYHRPDFRDGAFAAEAARFLDADDVIRVDGSNFLGFMLWQLSGARLAVFDDERLENNDARIRYADLAQRFDERMSDGGFEADYVIVRASDAPPGAEPLVAGEFRAERWVLLPSGPAR